MKIVEISFKKFRGDKYILFTSFNGYSESFVGKYQYKERITRAIEEEDWDKLLFELEHEIKKDGVYYYLLALKRAGVKFVKG